jgi:CHAD domain-containing protein
VKAPSNYQATELKVRALFLQSIAKMLAHKEFMLDAKAPEELHDFRVGLREVRSNLKNLSFIFDNKDRLRALLQELAWIDDLISAVRDAAVLRKLVGVKSSTAQKILAEAVNSPRCDEMLVELQDFVQKAKMKKRFVRDFNAFAKPLFKHRYKELRNIARDVNYKKSSDRKLHRLRIATKRVRYLGEVCVLHTPSKKLSAKVERLVTAQTMLGDYNDLVIARNWLSGNNGDQQLDALLATQQLELRRLMRAKLRF